MLAALDDALDRIGANTLAGLPALRPCPELAQPGRAWIKAGHYWIAYSLNSPPEVVAVFLRHSRHPRSAVMRVRTLTGPGLACTPGIPVPPPARPVDA